MTQRAAPVSSASRPVLRARRLWARLGLGLGLAVTLASPRPAAAWDPATTHLGMVDRAVVESALHLRWMAGSELQRGLFTPLRLDPARLSPGERFQTLRDRLGDAFEVIEIDSRPGNSGGFGKMAHSVLTLEVREVEGQQAYQARERVVQFLKERLT